MRTLSTLDINHDGRVDTAEVGSYADKQGFDAEAAKQELLSLDSNGDGVLDMMELRTVLEDDTSESGSNAEESTGLLAKESSTDSSESEAEPEPAVVSPPAAAAADADGAAQDSNGEKAARKFAKLLALHERKSEEARGLLEKAESLRKNATSIARSAHQRALRAGADASQKKTESFLASIKKLEKDASDAETKAAGLRARSQAELNEARNLMAVSKSALEQ